MRHRESSRTGRLFRRAGAAHDPAMLETLETRRLLSTDLGGVRFVYDGDGQVEIRWWTGAADVTGEPSSDTILYDITSEQERGVGQNDFDILGPIGWDRFELARTGAFDLFYTDSATDPYESHIGASFHTEQAYPGGWLFESNADGRAATTFLHDRPTAAAQADLIGRWHYVAIAVPVDGAPAGTEILGAYGVVNVLDEAGNITYTSNTKAGKEDGTGAISEFSALGLGKTGDADYFQVSAGGDMITAVDVDYADGLTYIAVAVRRAAMTEEQVVGGYRFTSILADNAATARGESLVAFENVYLELKEDGTLTAFDLEDFDAGLRTPVHSGSWTLLPEGSTVSLVYDGLEESHFLAFGAGGDAFLDLRAGSETGASYILGFGTRAAPADSGDRKSVV